MNHKIKIRAAVLLLVFSLNTVVSLACGLGFNFKLTIKKDAIANNASIGHHHSAGSGNHDHGEGRAAKAHSHSHEASGHHHPKEVQAIPPADLSLTHFKAPQPDDCCADEVSALNLLDKAINQNSNPHIIAEALHMLSAYIIAVHADPQASITLHPPSPRSWPLATHTDLRIAIQSFQI